MRILILSAKLPFPPKDGGAIATLNMATGLAKAGNEITLLCLNTNKHYFPVDGIPDSITSLIRIIGVKHNIKVYYVPAILNLLFSRKPYNAIRFYSKRFNIKLREILKNEAFDIIQMEGPYMSWYFSVIKAFSAAKISMRAHNVESEIWHRKALQQTFFLKKWYFAIMAKRIFIFEKNIIAKADMIIPISKEVGQGLLFPELKLSSHISPTGFLTENYPCSTTKSMQSLFFIGSLDWTPNIDGLNWFLQNVWIRNDFNISLHVAGRNTPKWFRKKLISIPGLVFHGEVDDVQEFMARSDILISPLFSGSGIRIKILEAMLMGKIVIATPLSAEGIPVTDGENIILARDEAEFKSRIKSLSANPESYVHIGENARSLIAENFNNLALCKKLTIFYRDHLT